MKVTTGFEGREEAIVALFLATFTASEGVEEGGLIGDLVRDLLAQTARQDIRAFCAEKEGIVIGAAIFTRLHFSEDPALVFLLSPLAVAPDHQRKGVGQALLRHALDALSLEGVQIAMTYGDPNFYGRVGFRPITEAQVRAPLPLSLPDGWIGKPLKSSEMPTLQGPSTCVSALNRSDVW
jgi:putative acetyltransferase